MTSHDPIRAIGRGLAVIEALNKSPVTSLAELHRWTGLPKPSLVRLLDTLIDAGYAVRVSRNQGYALTAAVLRLACGVREKDRLVDIARPLMEDFTRDHRWQVSLSTSETDAMRVRFTTRHISPFARDRNYMNSRVHMLSSAVGRAYFAHCAKAERDVILRARRDAQDVVPYERDHIAMAQLVRRVRAQGFAVPERANSDGTRSIAVPILRPGELDGPDGAIALVYYGSAMTLDQALATYLSPLRRLAAKIGAGVGPPKRRTPQASAVAKPASQGFDGKGVERRGGDFHGGDR